MLESCLQEFRRQDAVIRRVLGQMDDAMMNRLPVEGGNSIGMLIRHLHGNLLSRFTDFLHSDGEKPWRNREGEFERRFITVNAALGLWEEAWTLLESTLQTLGPGDLERKVSIRGVPFSVQEALLRALGHVSYHAGQIVLLGRTARKEEWEWISIPPGGTAAYNTRPDKEKGLSR
ncbi:MAG: DUF1572 family protein [Bacteroidetes bacterium]|nr:DUF1572 family protein [Bacteroidota bacterium]MDA0874098.1 DUF1572 family protein [Bacteroidota bacterium]